AGPDLAMDYPIFLCAKLERVIKENFFYTNFVNDKKTLPYFKKIRNCYLITLTNKSYYCFIFLFF
ncbi:hypothetical protein, partial [Tetragenococcus halophilus]|uniref:hypothetical protein n=1 Tax=Tetragenococcus halophilus TaxID=51669 RepID=UPI001CA5DA80